MLPFAHECGKRLSELTTFGIGGPARYFAIASSKEELQTMLEYCHRSGLPFFILGKGSNCLFDDRGYAGLVIQNKIDFLENKENLFQVGAGYSFARLGGQTARQGWTGLEFASGIPATVGGAIFMNAGANGQETADCLMEVVCVSETGELVRFARHTLLFGYRTSSFHQWKGAIVECVFALERSEEAKRRQKELLDYRLKTQPYGDKSAGCAFRNPTSSSAGYLIDRCGLKDFQVGGAAISNAHANFIVNRGSATAADVQELMQQVKQKIYSQTGIQLEAEIRIVPYE